MFIKQGTGDDFDHYWMQKKRILWETAVKKECNQERVKNSEEDDTDRFAMSEDEPDIERRSRGVAMRH